MIRKGLVLAILILFLPVMVNAACEEYSHSYFLNRTFASSDDNFIPDTDCKCNYSFFAVESVAGWECRNVSITSLVNDTVLCSQHLNESYDEIFNTGYCCPEKYFFNESQTIEYIENGNPACYKPENELPVPFIFEPRNSKVMYGDFVEFSAQGSYDPDYKIVAYVWNFDFEEKPWGRIVADGYEVRCLSYKGTNISCPVEQCNYYGDLDLENFGNLCVCKSNRTSIFEEKIVNTTDKKILFKYPYQYACDYYNISDKCEVALTVYDDEGAFSTLKFNITLYSNTSNGSSSSSSSSSSTPLECLNVNCPTSVSDCIYGQKIVAVSGDPCCSYKCQNVICGDGTCDTSFGETSDNCIEDCHCGDGVCQTSFLENENNCYIDCSLEPGTSSPSSSSSSSSSKSSPILLILAVLVLLVLGGGGIGLFAYKKGWFDDILEKAGIKKKENPGKDIFGQNIPPSSEDKTATNNSESEDLGAIKSYIKSSRASGLSYSQIRSRLVSQGWDEEVINKAFNELK